PIAVDAPHSPPPPGAARVPARSVCPASADRPPKGVAVLLRAIARLAQERHDVNLTVVSKPKPGGPTDRLVDDLGLRDRVTFVNGIDDTALGDLIAGAQIAVVPSFYEGFSLPAAAAMASGTLL